MVQNKDISEYANSYILKEKEDLRKELQNEIKKRLPKYVFTWAVAVLVFIIGIFYTISYSDVLEWKKESMEKIYKIEAIISPQKK